MSMRPTMLLIAFLITTSGVRSAPVGAQSLTDAQLIERGVRAYDQGDFIQALRLIFAYEQRSPSEMAANPAFASQVREAWSFSATFLSNIEAQNERMRSQILQLGGSTVTGRIFPPELSAPPRSRRQVVSASGTMVSASGTMVSASGTIRMLRVHDVGTGYGPANDHLDGEVVVQLVGVAGAFGFQLRQDQQRVARAGMLQLLQGAFENDWTVNLNFLREEGKANSVIIRVWVTK